MVCLVIKLKKLPVLYNGVRCDMEDQKLKSSEITVEI